MSSELCGKLEYLDVGGIFTEKVYYLRHFDSRKIVKCPLAMSLIKKYDTIYIAIGGTI